MLGRLGRLLSDVLAHLPAVLFLVSLCVMAHHTETYAKVEGLSVMLVGSLAPKKALPESVPPPTVALTASPEFFYNAYDGRLPLSRKTTAEVVSKLVSHGPKLIALDVDVARAGSAANEETEANLLIGAIRDALVAGIDVVAVTYPQTDSTRRDLRDAWLNHLCTQLRPSEIEKAAASSPAGAAKSKKQKGVFVLASPMLARERPFELVYRVTNNPPRGDKEDHRLFAVISALSKSEPAASFCSADQLNAAALHKIDNLEREWPDLKKMHRIRFVDGRSEPSVVGVSLLSMSHLNEIAPGLKGRTVLFGVKSFDGMDEFLTPFGEMPGAELQARIANSWTKEKDEDHRGMKDDHVKAALWDTLIGLAFVLTYLLMRGAFTWFDKLKARHFSSLVQLVLPLVAFGGFLLVALWLSAMQFASGQWLDPLPIMLGLSLHLYAESSGGKHHEHTTLPGWFAETMATWRSTFRGPFKLSGVTSRLDGHLFSMIRIAMVAAVIAAVYTLAHHHFQPH